jgi:hypothetical protein
MDHNFEELYAEIVEFTHQYAAPIVAHSVCTLLRYFRDPSELNLRNHRSRPHIQTQLQLGQGAFFAGLWTHQWLRSQELFHQDKKLKRQAQKWLVTLIHKIQQIPKTMWMIRNCILHRPSDSITTQQQHAKLNSIIQDIYKRKPHPRMMAPCDQRYFTKYDQENLKQMQIQRKTNWITGANLILMKYERSTTVTSERFMSYFQWDTG